MDILLRLPLPSEVKWQYILDLTKTLTVEYYQDLNRTLPEHEARTMVSRALYASGRKWMVNLRRNHKDSAAGLEPMGDLINRVFRALDIDTSVTVGPADIAVVNHRCPYLEHGTAQGVAADTLCQMICGMGTSLVEGINDGFPHAVRYRPEEMMGKGRGRCAKRFALKHPPGPVARPVRGQPGGPFAWTPATGAPENILRVPVRIPALPPKGGATQEKVQDGVRKKARGKDAGARVEADGVAGAKPPALDDLPDPHGDAARPRGGKGTRPGLQS